MGFNISKIINDELNVKVTGALGENRNIIDNRTNPVVPANSGEVEVFKTESPFILDYLEFSTNHIDGIRLRIYHGMTQTLLIPSVDATASEGMTAKNINDNVSGFFDVLEYNTSRNTYKFRLHQPIPLPIGCKITLQNTKSTDYRMLLYGFGRNLS